MSREVKHTLPKVKKGYTGEDYNMDYLILVNREFPLQTPVEEETLCQIDADHEDIKLNKEAAMQLRALLDYIDSGDLIVPVSGFRTYEEQKKIFEESMIDNGESYTLKYVAYPNCSEHQTGLAIDLAENREKIDFIAPDFPYEGICNEFRKNAHKFGFIERYPRGKESITGIAHEPWHFRYVGVSHAKEIREKGIVLEEYVG